MLLEVATSACHRREWSPVRSVRKIATCPSLRPLDASSVATWQFILMVRIDLQVRKCVCILLLYLCIYIYRGLIFVNQQYIHVGRAAVTEVGCVWERLETWDFWNQEWRSKQRKEDRLPSLIAVVRKDSSCATETAQDVGDLGEVCWSHLGQVETHSHQQIA